MSLETELARVQQEIERLRDREYRLNRILTRRRWMAGVRWNPSVLVNGRRVYMIAADRWEWWDRERECVRASRHWH